MVGSLGGSSLKLFFFQAEDGIRDGHVTGVQTCALPISALGSRGPGGREQRARRGARSRGRERQSGPRAALEPSTTRLRDPLPSPELATPTPGPHAPLPPAGTPHTGVAFRFPRRPPRRRFWPPPTEPRAKPWSAD